MGFFFFTAFEIVFPRKKKRITVKSKNALVGTTNEIKNTNMFVSLHEQITPGLKALFLYFFFLFYTETIIQNMRILTESIGYTSWF